MTDTTTPNPVHAGEADRWGGWTWREPSRGEHFRRCSYCGSMHPEDLVTIARGRVDWADRKYGWPHKFYVHVPNQNPAALFVLGASLQAGDYEGRPGWVRHEDLTEEHRAILDRDGWKYGDEPGGMLQFGTRREHFGKVYTVHLADPMLSGEVRDQAAELCGLRFTFIEGGRISWEPAR
jgi:hypothetical protein